MNAGISIGAAVLFIKFAGEGADDTVKAIKGASGSALGTGSGVFIALVFVAGVYFYNRKKILHNVRHDITGKEDSYWVITKDILFIVTPFILSTFIYNCTTAVNQTVYAKAMLHVHDLTQSEISTYYGIFSGKSIVLRNVPVALASAMSSAVIPTIAEAWVLGDKKGARHKVDRAIKVTMVVAIPCVAGFLFLARPIVQLLFPQKSSLDLAARLLTFLAITVAFYCVSTITNGVLQSIGQVNKPVIHASIALGIQFVILEILLKFTHLNLYALVVADILYSLLMCVLNGASLRKHLNYHQEWMSTFVLPAGCALVMGFLARVTYQIVRTIGGGNAVSLSVSIAVAVIAYFVLVLISGAVSGDEIKSFPKGRTLYGIACKMHLISEKRRRNNGV